MAVECIITQNMPQNALKALPSLDIWSLMFTHFWPTKMAALIQPNDTFAPTPIEKNTNCMDNGYVHPGV